MVPDTKMSKLTFFFFQFCSHRLVVGLNKKNLVLVLRYIDPIKL